MVAWLLLGFAPYAPAAKMQQLPPQTVVVTYHDMIERRDKDSLWFDCTISEFKEQLEAMSVAGATFIGVEQLERHLTSGEPLPAKPVLITFADNYLGFYSYALPILRKRKIPSVMFVHTDFVGSKVGRPKMSWEQLQELDREGLVTIASQTRTHPADLRKLSGEQLRWEFVGSKRVIEEKLGHEVRYLAYPSGKFDERVAKYAEVSRYRLAFTEEQEPAELAPDLWRVPRYVHTKYREALERL